MAATWRRWCGSWPARSRKSSGAPSGRHSDRAGQQGCLRDQSQNCRRRRLHLSARNHHASGRDDRIGFHRPLPPHWGLRVGREGCSTNAPCCQLAFFVAAVFKLLDERTKPRIMLPRPRRSGPQQADAICARPHLRHSGRRRRKGSDRCEKPTSRNHLALSGTASSLFNSISTYRREASTGTYVR